MAKCINDIFVKYLKSMKTGLINSIIKYLFLLWTSLNAFNLSASSKIMYNQVLLDFAQPAFVCYSNARNKLNIHLST